MESLDAGPLLLAPSSRAAGVLGGSMPVTVSVTGAESDVDVNRISTLSW